MLRALSTRRSSSGPNKYEKLADEPANVYLLQDMNVEPQLKRVTTLPPAFFTAKEIESFSRRQQLPVVPEFLPAAPEKLSKAKSTKKAEKIHPLFGFMDSKRRRKATAKPEFARYVEYLKEGGFVGGVRQQGS